MTDHLWEDIQSVLRDDIEKTQGYTNRQEMNSKDVFFGEEAGANVLDPCLGIQLRPHQPQPFHSWERVTNQCFDRFCDTRLPFSGTKNDARQHLGQQEEEADQIVSDLELACQVPSNTLFTKDSNEYESSEILHSQSACHDNKLEELENETIPFAALLHFDDFISMETHNFVQNLHSADDQQTSFRKGPLQTVEGSKVDQSILCDEINSQQRSDVGPSNKLFGTLSLLFQAFANPMSEELEQRCFHVLEKAYTEIRSVQSIPSFDCS